jgi:hypothetical protein
VNRNWKEEPVSKDEADVESPEEYLRMFST